jgi:hypothetical protein
MTSEPEIYGRHMCHQRLGIRLISREGCQIYSIVIFKQSFTNYVTTLEYVIILHLRLFSTGCKRRIRRTDGYMHCLTCRPQPGGM